MKWLNITNLPQEVLLPVQDTVPPVLRPLNWRQSQTNKKNFNEEKWKKLGWFFLPGRKDVQ